MDASEKIKTGLELNRSALELWRTGTLKNEAYSRLPGRYQIDEERVSRSLLREVAQFGLYEASRLESIGEFAAAWDWYNAVLRFGRQIGRHGMIIESLTGVGISKTALESAKNWSERPEVDLILLRKAKADVAQLEELGGLPSDMLKSEYLYTIKHLDHTSTEPPITQQDMLNEREGKPKSLSRRLREASWPLVQLARGEPERSKRLAKELMTYYLEACDNPHWMPKDDPNWAANPYTTKAPWTIPDELIKRCEGTDIRNEFGNLKGAVIAEAGHKVQLRAFQKQIAERIDRLEVEARN